MANRISINASRGSVRWQTSVVVLDLILLCAFDDNVAGGAVTAGLAPHTQRETVAASLARQFAHGFGVANGLAFDFYDHIAHAQAGFGCGGVRINAGDERAADV